MDSLNKRLSLREKVDLLDGARYFDLDLVSWDSLSDSYSRSTLVAMSPADFLTLAAPIGDGAGTLADPETGRQYDPYKMERVVDTLERGWLLEDIPFLNLGDPTGRFDEGLKVTGHEGRHRAMALEKMGVRLMPVRLSTRDYRWGRDDKSPPEHLTAEDGWEWCDCSVSGRSEVRLKRTEKITTPQSLSYPSEGEGYLLWTLGAAEDPDLLRSNGKSAQRDDPALWERVKAEVTRGSKGGRPGQWSARKAQMAVRLYKERGGGYIGPRDPDNSLTRWTEQDWRTRSGEPSLVTGERYLPSDALADLTPSEYAATTRAKRAGMLRGEQYVDQPERIARKTAKHRRNR
jgi:hypothetical protein